MSPLKPAVPNHGIVFRRIDLGIDIEARFDRIVATRSRTTLRHSSASGAVVGTVEHLMAALASYGVDNLLIEVDGPELPILDGSAASFVFLLECAGIVAQPVERSASEVLRCVRVENGDAFGSRFNPGSIWRCLRMPDEFVRQKPLDVVGDLALAGAPLRARFIASLGALAE